MFIKTNITGNKLKKKNKSKIFLLIPKQKLFRNIKNQSFSRVMQLDLEVANGLVHTVLRLCLEYKIVQKYFGFIFEISLQVFNNKIFDFRKSQFILTVKNLVAHFVKRLWDLQAMWENTYLFTLEKNHLAVISALMFQIKVAI